MLISIALLSCVCIEEAVLSHSTKSLWLKGE